MTQILDSLSSESAHHILYGYTNTTSLVQIIRITNIPSWYFERVVFPRQRLLFGAPTQAQLEVYTSEFPVTLLAERIACECLRASDDLPRFAKHN